MDKKIKVLVVPSDHFGVGLYRSISPHVKLNDLYGEDFDIEINYNPNWSDFQSFDKYDIIQRVANSALVMFPMLKSGT